MSLKETAWIKSVLANDENATNQELREYFMEEGNISSIKAEKWIALRQYYLGDMYCNMQPA